MSSPNRNTPLPDRPLSKARIIAVDTELPRPFLSDTDSLLPTAGLDAHR